MDVKDKATIVSLLRKYAKQMPKSCRRDFMEAVEFYAGSSATSYSCLESSSPVPFVEMWWGVDYLGRIFHTFASRHRRLYLMYQGDFIVIAKHTSHGYRIMFSANCVGQETGPGPLDTRETVTV